MNAKRNELIAVILMLAVTAGTIVGITAIEQFRRRQFFTVELIARSPLSGNWYPKTIKLAYGKEARILIRNIETVSHGFALPEFSVGVKEIKAGEVAVVAFTPDKRGTFPFYCTVWCSNEHMHMTGEVVVE